MPVLSHEFMVYVIKEMDRITSDMQRCLEQSGDRNENDYQLTLEESAMRLERLRARVVLIAS